MTDILWMFIFAQMMMGAFDTIHHHEGTERLAWRPSQQVELNLHGVRNLAYALMFTALGWFEPMGLWASALLALLAGELLITLWDFVEEDRTRHLPSSERVTHTLLTLNYGVILAMLVPWLIGLAQLPTALPTSYHGIMSWFCAISAVGVIFSGLRDLHAAQRTTRLTERAPATLATALPPQQTVLITGGTGFIGSRLVTALVAAGHQVMLLTRNRAKAGQLTAASPVRYIESLDEITKETRIDAIINLAGEPISDGLWTKRKRLSIVRSRLATTYSILRLIARLSHKPSVFVSGSAIGWYGLRGDEMLTEANTGAPCFSRRVCVSWERAAGRAANYGVRTVLLRTGLVLDRSGGMLARLLAPFEFGLGGWFGNGSHWMSWIHRDDMVRLICHAVATEGLAGPLNAVAPEPATNCDFTAALGKALSRPAIMPIPRWPLQLLLGDFAEELLLSGQRVYPKAALESGFVFEYATLEAALAQIVGAPHPFTSRRPVPERLTILKV
ncbi:TIGR01777 family oxidoreductase [Aquidulcibacter sp.]|uniref:TIGR01777 family oxidoreductase n=1 Tax=Aquidulcibacter sp. TaxID=2052990 RepID=UPI003BA4A473